MADSLIGQWSFHHFGVASESIEKTFSSLKPMGYELHGSPFEDVIQGIRGQFAVSALGPRLEIVENLPGRDTITPWLNRSAVFYHVAYTVKDFDLRVSELISTGGILLGKGVVPAVAFGGKRICFVMLPSRLLIELIEDDC